jgi:hypothetical protein
MRFRFWLRLGTLSVGLYAQYYNEKNGIFWIFHNICLRSGAKPDPEPKPHHVCAVPALKVLLFRFWLRFWPLTFIPNLYTERNKIYIKYGFFFTIMAKLLGSEPEPELEPHHVGEVQALKKWCGSSSGSGPNPYPLVCLVNKYKNGYNCKWHWLRL